MIIRVDKRFADQLIKLQRQMSNDKRKVVKLTEVTRVVEIKKRLKNI